MSDIIKGLLLILKDYTVYADDVPFKKVDFKNGQVGIYYEMDGATDELYRQDYDLRICVTGHSDYMLKLIETVEAIDSILNKSKPTQNSRVKHKNAFLNTMREENQITYILEYFVKEIRG